MAQAVRSAIFPGAIQVPDLVRFNVEASHVDPGVTG